MRVYVDAENAASPKAYVGRHYAPAIVAAAFDYIRTTYERSVLPLRVFEAARARTAEINGCQLCQGWRSGDDVKPFLAGLGSTADRSVADNGPAPDEAFYREITNWRSSPLYSDREKTAIEFAEKMGTAPLELALDEAFWLRAKALFSDEEIVDLSYCVAGWMGFGRVSHVLGIDAICQLPTRGAQQAA